MAEPLERPVPATAAALAGVPSVDQNTTGEDGEHTKRTSLQPNEHDVADATSTGEGESDLPMSKAKCIALVATVTGAAFLNTVSIQSVVIILPTIGHHLNIPESRQQWIVSSYSLTFGCFLLLWGRIADIYGKRLIFILGSVWVTAVTAANAFVPNEIAFDVFRGLHGLGAAANVPTAIGILGVTFPPGKAKNYAFSTYAAGAPLGSVFGNLFSGIIAEYANWKWVFGVSAILAGFITVAGIFFIPSHPPPVKGTASSSSPAVAAAISPSPHSSKRLPPVDWVGGTLITVGLIGLTFALTEGNVVGWSTTWVPVTIVISVLLIVVFAYWQHYLEKRMVLNSIDDDGVMTTHQHRPPLVKISIFRNLRFSATMIIMCLFFAAFNNYLIFTTYYFQDFQGLSPIQTTLRFIPTGVTGVIIAFIVAQLLSRVPTVFILITGNLAVSIACLLYAVPIAPTTSYFAFGLPAMILAVLGADSSWPCLTLFTSHSLPREDQAMGGALINAVSQVGRSIGLAVGTAIQTAALASARDVPIKEAGGILPWDTPSLKSLRTVSWANFGFGIASLAMVLVAFRTTEIVGKTGMSKAKVATAAPRDEEAAVVRATEDTGAEKRATDR